MVQVLGERFHQYIHVVYFRFEAKPFQIVLIDFFRIKLVFNLYT